MALRDTPVFIDTRRMRLKVVAVGVRLAPSGCPFLPDREALRGSRRRPVRQPLLTHPPDIISQCCL